jgi:hypothetical protein
MPTSITRTLLDPQTKIKYAKAAIELFNEELLMKQWFSQNSDGVLRGKYLEVPFSTGRSAGGSGGNEASVFPEASARGWDTLKFLATYYRTTVRVTHRAVDDTKGSDNSFISAIEEAYRQGPQEISREISMDMYAGRFGVRCVFDNDAGAGVHNVYSGADAAFTMPEQSIGTRLLLEQGRYCIMNPTTGVLATDTGQEYFYVRTRNTTGQFVASKVPDALVAFVSGAGAGVAAVQGDWVCKYPTPHWGAGTANDPVGDGVFGLNEMIANQTFNNAQLFSHFGIDFDRTTLPYMDSIVLEKNAVDLAEIDLEEVLDAIGARSGERLDQGGRGKVILPRHALNFMKRWNENMRVFQPRQIPAGIPGQNFSFQQGPDALSFDVDPKCPAHTMFFLNKDYVEWYENEAVQTEDADGGPLHLVRAVSGTAVTTQQIYEILWYWRGNFFTRNPNKHGKIFNFTTGSYTPEYGQGATFVPYV